MDENRRSIESITRFIFIDDEPCRSDIIFLPGAIFAGHAERAAELYAAGMAPLILPSGRYGIKAGKTKPVPERDARYSGEYRTEWEFMRRVLMDNGVPEAAILREEEATYTWENALLSRKVTDSLGLKIRRAILCCKPYHAARSLVYYQAAFPETEFRVCPARNAPVTKENWYLTVNGRNKVLSEVEKMGGQVRKQLEMLMPPCEL
ncbi:MAG: hypothetical protein CW338_04960 [Clostridiales bacterium]|nr:hypothetical protein [Clostridiales bacterium]